MTKTVRLELRLSLREKDRVERAAAALRMSVSAFVRMAICDEAMQTLEDLKHQAPVTATTTDMHVPDQDEVVGTREDQDWRNYMSFYGDSGRAR